MFTELKHTILLLFTAEQFNTAVLFLHPLQKRLQPSQNKPPGKHDPTESVQNANSSGRQGEELKARLFFSKTISGHSKYSATVGDNNGSIYHAIFCSKLNQPLC